MRAYELPVFEGRATGARPNFLTKGMPGVTKAESHSDVNEQMVNVRFPASQPQVERIQVGWAALQAEELQRESAPDLGP